MSKVVKIMQLLTESGMHLSWPAIEWLAKRPEGKKLEPSTSCFRKAMELFDERHPSVTDKNQYERLRGGYHIAYSEFEEEFRRKIDEYGHDKENRIAYVKRMMDDLYMGEIKYRSLIDWGDYVLGTEFKALKSDMSLELWNELELSGAAAHQAGIYGVAISNMLERALQIDGVPLNEHNRLWKEPTNDKMPPEEDLKKTKFEEVLEVIDSKVNYHILNSNGFLRKVDPKRYTPVNKFWNDLSDVDRATAIERYSGLITEFLGQARELANVWYDEKQQYVLLQPERAREVTIEHRDYYVNEIKETYLPVQFWYSDYCKDGHLDAQGLERKIFYFCYDTERPFENGLCLFANLYACYLVVELFNNELSQPNRKNASRSQVGHQADIDSQVGANQLMEYSFVDIFFDQVSAPEIVNKLKRLYQNASPNQYAYMLYALHDLGLIPNPATSKKIKLHMQLAATFGKVGSRQNLNDLINKLNIAGQYESAEIQRHKSRIQKAK